MSDDTTFPKPKRTLGIIWFESEAEHKALKTICTDLEGDYEAWKIEAEQAWENHTGEQELVKIRIQPDKFQAWCKAQHKPTNKTSRQNYVGLITAKADKERLAAWKQERNARKKEKKTKPQT